MSGVNYKLHPHGRTAHWAVCATLVPLSVFQSAYLVVRVVVNQEVVGQAPTSVTNGAFTDTMLQANFREVDIHHEDDPSDEGSSCSRLQHEVGVGQRGDAGQGNRELRRCVGIGVAVQHTRIQPELTSLGEGHVGSNQARKGLIAY